MPRKKSNETIENKDIVLEDNKDSKENKETKEDKTTQIKGIVNAKGGLRIREEMNTNCNVIDILPYNTEIEILEVFDEWVRVENGYMMKKFIDIIQ